MPRPAAHCKRREVQGPKEDGITPEFNFVAQCCRRNFAGPAGAPSLDRTLDWGRFVRTARFHRVQGLVWAAIASSDLQIPEKIRKTVSEDATSIAADNLRAAKESKDLHAAFGRAGLPLLFVKGITLAMLAYGQISAKAGVDIDILIDRLHLRQASELLRDQGYELVQPASAERLATCHDVRKESTWVNRQRRTQIDLHTRLADNPRLIPQIDLSSPTQPVEVAPGIGLPTLADEELFAYLTVHGASSAWFRLKWITDFAAFLHRFPMEEIERLYRRSQELGAGRAPGQALLLADALYGTLDNAAALKRSIARDRQARRLAGIAMRQLAGAAEPIEPTARPFGTAAIHASQFLLLSGLGFKLSEFVRQARGALA